MLNVETIKMSEITFYIALSGLNILKCPGQCQSTAKALKGKVNNTLGKYKKLYLWSLCHYRDYL